MALKGDRVVLETDITLTFNSVQNRGVTACYVTSGSGIALGDRAGSADALANPSGSRPAGLLLNDVVQLDETRYHRNFMKLQQLVGERSTLLRKGRVTTDQIVPGLTINPGDPAYLAASGQLTNVKSATGGLKATPPVGQFQGFQDELGFATVDINLPFPQF